MKYDIKRDGGKMLITVEGRMDALAMPDLQNDVKPGLADVSAITLDFSRVEYISSAGLRTMLWIFRNMKMGGTMKVINANAITRQVFTVTGFNEIFTIE